MATKWKTEDGYVFTLQPDGTVGDGDMSWPSKKDFFKSMKDNEIKIKTISGDTETSKLKTKKRETKVASLRSSKDNKFKGHTTYKT